MSYKVLVMWKDIGCHYRGVRMPSIKRQDDAYEDVQPNCCALLRKMFIIRTT
jgi:hypothetical protein